MKEKVEFEQDLEKGYAHEVYIANIVASVMGKEIKT